MDMDDDFDFLSYVFSRGACVVYFWVFAFSVLAGYGLYCLVF